MDREPALDDLARLLAAWLVTDYEAEQRETRSDEAEAQAASAD